jgi:two-component system CheB/CheR fusion protein
MRDRTDDALHANAFLTSVLSSVPQSVVVVDRAFRVGGWSRAASEAWGLREGEVRNEHFLNLDIGIPTGELRDPIRKVLSGEQQDDVVLRGHNRRGQPVDCTISFAALLGPQDTVQGAILLMTLKRRG